MPDDDFVIPKEDLEAFPAALIQRVFRLFRVLNKLETDQIFSAVYNSEFYFHLVSRPEAMFGYATYWAYYQIALQSGYEPKEPMEYCKMDIDTFRVRAATDMFEALRLRVAGADPGYIAESLILKGFFRGVIEGTLSEDEAASICNMIAERIEKRRDDAVSVRCPESKG